MPLVSATPLYCNDDAAGPPGRQLAEDQRWKSKHFRVGTIPFGTSSENVADILTKPLGPTDFIAIYGKGGVNRSHCVGFHASV